MQFSRYVCPVLSCKIADANNNPTASSAFPSASCAISGSGKRGCACIPAPTRRAKRPSIRGSTTPSPTTTPNRSWRSPPPETSGSARVRLSHPLFSGPQPSGGAGCDALRNPKKPVFDFRAHFCHSAPMETHAFGFRLRANAPEGQKRFPISRKSGLSLSRPRAAV